MRARLAALGLGAIIGITSVNAQPPRIPNPYAPGTPAPSPPALLPPLVPQAPAAPTLTAPALPQPEEKIAFRAIDVSVKRVVGGWEVWAGQKVLRNTGENEANARDIARMLRELRPTEWATIGGTKPIIEYGLTNGRPAVTGDQTDAKDNNANAGGVVNAGGINAPVVVGTPAKFVQPIDIQSARVEPIRGVWCLRDDNSILLNFGPDKGSAEQAVAVIQKYGFNRIGTIGTPAQPAMSYFFVSLDKPRFGDVPIPVNAQIDALTRTGIPIPGVGYTGEMVKIDPRKTEVRKDGAEWVVACGPEILGRFGPTEWAAREAARTVQDARFTEFCKLGGTAGLTFFLTKGKPPTRAPFSAQGRQFDVSALKVQQINQKWAVTDAGRQLFEVGSAQEGETLVRVLKAYGFDQTAHLTAGSAKGGITFLVKNR